MAVNLPPLESLFCIPGVRLASTCAAIKHSDRNDLAVLAFAGGTTMAGVFTKSSFKAAPVIITQRHLASADPRAFVINSGNANAATGDAGLADAVACCREVAASLDVEPGSVLPFSTGVIGEQLPLESMLPAIRDACHELREDGWEAAARAIMTTDTGPKVLSRQVDLGGKTITVTGMAKGAGMIRPDMATMLAFIATDAAIDTGCLRNLVIDASRESFNRITVDGDTSTNDSFVIAATGAAENDTIRSADDAGYSLIREVIVEVARELAQRIIRDAEGATRFVTVTVKGGRSSSECLDVAYTIAESPLVKTALFAGDPNWGRFCMAIGRAGVKDLDPEGVSLWLDDKQIAAHGMPIEGYDEANAADVMAKPEFTVLVDLGRAQASETVWTSDPSYEYVRINAEYRT
jgi:glutamate N-acetyltransferase/amino-acid N-acetyltransferase